MTAPLTILYVEDDPDIRIIASTILQTIGGFSVLACESGEQAIESAKNAVPDIILLDIMMPGMDGPQTMRTLRNMPPLASKPYIFMTAKIQPCEVSEYMKLGAVGVIAKPFDPMQLCDQIARLYDRHKSKTGQI